MNQFLEKKEGKKKRKDSGKISEDTCRVHWDFSLDYQSLHQIEEI